MLESFEYAWRRSTAPPVSYERYRALDISSSVRSPNLLRRREYAHELNVVGGHNRRLGPLDHIGRLFSRGEDQRTKDTTK